MQQHEIALEPEGVYHVYNRGINGAEIFSSRDNYRYFLQQYTLYLGDFVDTYAYCLMNNHFHLLIRVKETIPVSNGTLEVGIHSVNRLVSKQFGKLFSSYTQAYNKTCLRTGALLERPFKRKLVKTESYFSTLLFYIHANPQLHGVMPDFRKYAHSSYRSHIDTQRPTRLDRTSVLDWFGGVEAYCQAHADAYDFESIKELQFD
jgi:putative transposase